MMLPLIGAARSRVDGRQKVTGTATYAAEQNGFDVLHAVLVLSSIASGHIVRCDTAEAASSDGVVLVMTPENAPRVNARPHDEHMHLLQDDRVDYVGQPIGVVVAQTLEQAAHAAARVRFAYKEDAAVTRAADAPQCDPDDFVGQPAQYTRGDPDAAFSAAPLQLRHTYRTPVEHHNPMEMHAAVARWDAGRLTVYDTTQGVWKRRATLAAIFALPDDRVRVVSPFVGGGFGCKGETWPHIPLAAMAAKCLQRPVKLELTRPQMFTCVGYRPPTTQTIAIGADAAGHLASLSHETLTQTCVFADWLETSGYTSRMLYAVPHLRSTHRLARVNAGKPTYMRAPGESTGTYALESALDELSYAAGVDPIELRLRNYAEHDPSDGRPFSSKSLRECYRIGAERFGWNARNPRPRSMRNGKMLVGMGMATATYPAWRDHAAAYIRIAADGSVLVQSGTQDLGTGSYTIFTQIAADTLGIAIERVRFELGDSTLPQAPLSGGSQSAASVGSAVYLAAAALRSKVLALAGRSAEDTDAIDYAAILQAHGRAGIDIEAQAHAGNEEAAFSSHAFGAQFARVEVDPDLGEVRVVQCTGAFACGRILNAKTARSQFVGGIVFGIGMALTEHTEVDERMGRVMSVNLAEYLLPTNADVPDIDICMIEERDEHVNPIGAKGIGEIGITGAAAAIANAVYHATGTRVRDLPITPDKIVAPAFDGSAV